MQRQHAIIIVSAQNLGNITMIALRTATHHYIVGFSDKLEGRIQNPVRAFPGFTLLETQAKGIISSSHIYDFVSVTIQ